MRGFVIFGTIAAIVGALFLATLGPLADDNATGDDAAVRQAIIQESLASYPGPCPCPYNTMRNGRRCGGNSAYSKPGGYEPICYDSDVTDGMVREYRSSHPGQ